MEDLNKQLLDAIKTNDIKLVKKLIQEGADVNKVSCDTYDWYFETPLLVAMNYRNADIVKILIEADADVNKADTWFITPLHWSTSLCGGNDLALAEILIKEGANINAVNFWGETPLCWAREDDNKAVIELLKQHGAKE